MTDEEAKKLEVEQIAQDLAEIFPPYQIYELLHPQKKPRGSIRRKRRRRENKTKEGFEIGKVLVLGKGKGGKR